MKILPELNELDDSLNLAISGKLDEAEDILKKLDIDDPRVSFNMGWHKMRHGNLYEAYCLLDKGRLIKIFGGTVPPYFTKRYSDENLKDKTLLFINEGGHGDEIINVRFIKNFYDMGAKIILASGVELYPLFKHIPYITALVDREHCQTIHHDYWVPAMSAAMHLKLEYKNLSGKPYLNYFSPREFPNKENYLKIGLKWSGNPKFEHQQHRKFPVEKMLSLTNVENCKFYSLQRDEDLLRTQNSLIDLKYEMKTWEDTAEIIMSMDLIITSCTSIAHLSGAMGKPTWVVVPALPYYMWAQPGEKSKWYDSVKLYRQKQYGEWSDVFEKIKFDLKNFKK
jgi:hypothetical protein